jgi:hypothetical protein
MIRPRQPSRRPSPMCVDEVGAVTRGCRADAKTEVVAVGLLAMVLGVLAVAAPAGAELELRRRLEQGLERAELDVVDASAAWREHGGASCGRECMRAIANATDSMRLVRTDIRVSDTVWTVSIDLVDGRTGDVEASVADTCEICGVDEVGEIVAARAAGLAERTRAIASAPPILSVRTEPDGATVLVDGVIVGRSPVRHELGAGRHVVRVQQSGFAPQERVVLAQAGVHESLAVELTPQPELASERRARRRALGLGGASLTAGALAIAAGVPLLVIDGRDYRQRCNGDVDGDCQFQYQTRVGGAVATAVGIALVAAGATVIGLVRARKGARGERAGLRRGLVWRF